MEVEGWQKLLSRPGFGLLRAAYNVQVKGERRGAPRALGLNNVSLDL